MDENFFFNVQYFLKGTVDVIISDPIHLKISTPSSDQGFGRYRHFSVTEIHKLLLYRIHN